LLSGGVLARYKDGVDQDHKDAKRLAFNFKQEVGVLLESKSSR